MQFYTHVTLQKGFCCFLAQNPALILCMEHVKILVIVLGGLGVILVPTLSSLMFQSWNKLRETLDRNTTAIVKLESRLDLLWKLSQEIPKIKQDVNAAHQKLRLNKDKDNLLDD